jgi:hypothetical protein
LKELLGKIILRAGEIYQPLKMPIIAVLLSGQDKSANNTGCGKNIISFKY